MKLSALICSRDKSGTGENPSVTNDVGRVRLPGGRGTLALAVFIEDSELDGRAQEEIIAEVARAAYDSYMKLPPAAR